MNNPAYLLRLKGERHNEGRAFKKKLADVKQDDSLFLKGEKLLEKLRLGYKSCVQSYKSPGTLINKAESQIKKLRKRFYEI
ncbi:MAG: hypothetical protein HYV28_18550 [Ignavibacteriales bacterium]|nr:hypothetical protein [Ignavibacteriales bacterium]